MSHFLFLIFLLELDVAEGGGLDEAHCAGWISFGVAWWGQKRWWQGWDHKGEK